MREEPTKTKAAAESSVSRRMYRPEHSPEKRSSFLRLHTVGERVLSETNFQATREHEQQRFNSSSFETRDEEKEKEKEERSESLTRREASSSNAILERFLKKLERDFQGEKKNGLGAQFLVRINNLKIVFKIRKRQRMTRSICCEKLWRNPNRLSRTRE